MQLSPCGSAVARFVDPDGKPLVGYEPGLKIVVTPGPPRYSRGAPEKAQLTADETFVANFDRRHYWEGPKTDKQGLCTFPALVPGAAYRLTSIEPGTGEVVEKEFKVESGKTFQFPDIIIKHPG